jgi:hypothetical protein
MKIEILKSQFVLFPGSTTPARIIKSYPYAHNVAYFNNPKKGYNSCMVRFDGTVNEELIRVEIIESIERLDFEIPKKSETEPENKSETIGDIVKYKTKNRILKPENKHLLYL